MYMYLSAANDTNSSTESLTRSLWYKVVSFHQIIPWEAKTRKKKSQKDETKTVEKIFKNSLHFCSAGLQNSLCSDLVFALAYPEPSSRKQTMCAHRNKDVSRGERGSRVSRQKVDWMGWELCHTLLKSSFLTWSSWAPRPPRPLPAIIPAKDQDFLSADVVYYYTYREERVSASTKDSMQQTNWMMWATFLFSFFLSFFSRTKLCHRLSFTALIEVWAVWLASAVRVWRVSNLRSTNLICMRAQSLLCRSN